MPTANVIYEVNVELPKDQEPAYMEWLKPHIQALLQIDGFLGATVFRSRALSEIKPDPHKVYWTVHYSMKSEAHLNAYFSNQAPQMRADTVARFGDKLAFSRRLLTDDTSVRFGPDTRR